DIQSKIPGRLPCYFRRLECGRCSLYRILSCIRYRGGGEPTLPAREAQRSLQKSKADDQRKQCVQFRAAGTMLPDDRRVHCRSCGAETNFFYSIGRFSHDCGIFSYAAVDQSILSLADRFLSRTAKS